MNIIETVKSIMTSAPGISQFTGGNFYDFMEAKDSIYSLFSTGDQLVSKDILGNQTRQHNFILQARNQSTRDFERLNNGSWLLGLHYWLENVAVQNQEVTSQIGDTEHTGNLLRMTCANGMSFEVSEDGQTTDYQLQIAALYTVKE